MKKNLLIILIATCVGIISCKKIENEEIVQEGQNPTSQNVTKTVYPYGIMMVDPLWPKKLRCARVLPGYCLQVVVISASKTLFEDIFAAAEEEDQDEVALLFAQNKTILMEYIDADLIDKVISKKLTTTYAEDLDSGTLHHLVFKKVISGEIVAVGQYQM